MPAMTRIRISRSTRDLLDTLKQRPTESYDEVIGRLALPSLDHEPFSDGEIEDMKGSLEDIRAGRVKTLKTVRTELGI